MKRGRAIGLRGVDVRPFLQQRADGRPVGIPGRVNQRQVAAGGAQEEQGRPHYDA